MSATPIGIGGHEQEIGAAGERLPEDHPAGHATGLSGPGDLPHALLGADLRRYRQGASGERPRPPGGDHQLEAGKMDAHDHIERMFAYGEGKLNPWSAGPRPLR